MDVKLTPFESEAIRSGWLPPTAIAKVSPAMRRYFGIDGRCDCRTVNDQGDEPRFWPCPVHGD